MRYRTIVADPPWDHSDGTGVNFADGTVTRLPYECMTVAEIKALPVPNLCLGRTHLYLWTTCRYLRSAFAVLDAWRFTYSAPLVWCKKPRGWAPGGTYANNVEFVLFGVSLNAERRLAEILRRACDGKIRAEIDQHFGTKNVAGHWFTPNSDLVGAPTDEQWKWLRRWLGIEDPEADALVAEVNAGKGTRQAATSRWFQWARGEHSRKPDAFIDLVEQVSPGPYLELFARRQRLGWDTWGDQALPHVELPA